MSDSSSPAEKGVKFLQRKAEDAEYQIAAENIFGRGVLAYQGITEVQKQDLWQEEGGTSFKGEFGAVKRYITGTSPNALASIQREGFQVGRGIINKIPGLQRVSNSEGKGIYLSTSTRAIKDYGTFGIGKGLGVVVDVAMGKELTPDSSLLLSIADKLKDPAQLLALLTGGVLGTMLVTSDVTGNQAVGTAALASGAFLAGEGLLFDMLYKVTEADTIKLTPRTFDTLLKTLRRRDNYTNPLLITQFRKLHNHWLVVRNPARLKIVGAVNSHDEAMAYTKGLDSKFT